MIHFDLFTATDAVTVKPGMNTLKSRIHAMDIVLDLLSQGTRINGGPPIANHCRLE
ncbi:hypothetical protein SAMN05444390_1011139 [Marinobacterium lutimaris]|uniref:Uncharacterized protein n=1 Tax=Marinobacterium lutimaris TaxID=568106 RepID=A0A1H5WR14_9GAMM|nr:hypothetical protein SAMN05444390_1011139 [Marinobacterium lutimaris]